MIVRMTGFVMLLALLIFVLYKLLLRARDHVEARKVIQMSLYRDQRKYTSKHTCSFCRKKAKRLSFYASEEGRVVGVCDLCKPLAERRALLRL